MPPANRRSPEAGEDPADCATDDSQDRIVLVLNRLEYAIYEAVGRNEPDQDTCNQDDGAGLLDERPCTLPHATQHRANGWQVVCRKLHDEWGGIACKEAGLLQNDARAENGDNAQEVRAGSNPPLATEHSTCKQSDNRELSARDERRGHNGHAAIVLVFNGSRRHNTGHAAAGSRYKNRHKRLAGKAEAAEHAVEDVTQCAI